MNKNFILKADILDIIFEKRNKDYGAYNLRKFYPSRLKLALGFMFIIAITFSAFTLLPDKRKMVATLIYDIPEPNIKKIEDKPKEQEKKTEVKKSETKRETKPTPVAEKKFISNPVVVDDNVKTDSIVNLLPEDKIGTTTVVTTTTSPVLVTPVKTEPGNGDLVLTTPKTDITTPRNGDAVDVLPSYPGGMEALKKFLEKHLQTPDELQAGETVSVRVKFVVGYNGKLQSFATVLDGGDAYNKEVVRVLKKMPDWTPGKAKGENVPVYYTIPVKFVTTY